MARAKKKVDPARRVAELVSQLRHHDDLYYNKARPEIADAEYDALRRELDALCEAHPELVPEDDPRARIGAPPKRARGFPQVPHRVPMLSLESLTSEDEVREFEARALRYLGDEDRSSFEWSLEPKYDGVSASLLYEDGALVRGLTRGDGRVGEEITTNLRLVGGVPAELKRGPALVEVRGEVLLSRARFVQLRGEQEERGEEPFRNPRNAVAGALKRVEPAGLAELGMRFVCWGVGDLVGWEDLGSYTELAHRLEACGVPISDLLETGQGVDAVLAYHRRLEERRDELEFELDGIVAKIDDFGLQRRLGRTERAPRWALAAKFAPRRGMTVVKDIVCQVGRTGAVTPVAVLEPVELAGVTVQRATLHNFDLLALRDVRIGDRVEVERAGDVIPEVVGVQTSARKRGSRRFHPPEACPECGMGLSKEGAFLYCTNIDCPAQIQGRIVHLASRRALDIDRLGPRYVDQLYEAGLLRGVEDVFRLDGRRDEVLALERWGEKAFDNLAAELERARRPTLPRFLYALGIRHVGEKVAADLAESFGSLDALAAADEDQLCDVEGVGPIVAHEVAGFFRNPANREFLAALAAAGVEVRELARRTAEAGPLAGRVFCFTGGLESMSRDQARERVEALGASTASSISARVTTVVAGSKAGSKLDKARDLGLELIDEDGFLALLEEHAR
ncbi:MAG: NAD-dependent DNA ligase LigA [Planctomycetota bacterium]